MGSRKSGINWRIGYTIFCVVYVGWVVFLSLDNFDMVHDSYREAKHKLAPERIREIAGMELAAKCRREAKQKRRGGNAMDEQSVEEEDPCLSWPASVLEQREERVAERLAGEKSRFLRKLIVFYISFVLVFLALPLVFLYYLVTFLLWILRNIKIIQ